MARLAALALALLLYSPSALAWGSLGHEAICELAFRELDDTARQRLIALIQLDQEFTTFRASCNWPDRPRQRASEHFINLPRDATGLEGDQCPMAEECVVSAIEHDFAVLASPDAIDEERLAALKFLGHWVGDIHQPLHAASQDDRGGNHIRTRGSSCGSLHTLWDSCIVEERLGMHPLAIVLELQAGVTDEQRAEWLASGPVDWANESFAIAREPDLGYCIMVDGTCHYAADNREFDQGEPERVVVVDDSYLDRHAPIARERIAMSGSLHTLWGSCIVEERLGMHPLAIAPELRAGITDEQRAEWLASGPVDWANESFAIAREPDLGYCIMVDGTCHYAADNREFDEGEPERVVVVDGGYLDMNAPIARGRIARQGFGWPACLIERWVIERCLNLASPVKQFTGPDAPRCQIRLSQRVSMASKGVPGDVPEQRDCEGYASGAPLPLTRAIGRTARARGANPVTKYHRELRSIRPSANGDTGRASPTTF